MLNFITCLIRHQAINLAGSIRANDTVYPIGCGAIF